MVNRYYTPTTDQFLSVDPELAETGQPYAFTNDDPLNLMDPLGLTAGWDCGGHEYGTTNGPPGGMTGCTGNTYTLATGAALPTFDPTHPVPKPTPATEVPVAEPTLAEFAQAYDTWWGQQLAIAAAAFAAAEAAEWSVPIVAPVSHTPLVAAPSTPFSDIWHGVTAAVASTPACFVKHIVSSAISPGWDPTVEITSGMLAVGFGTASSVLSLGLGGSAGVIPASLGGLATAGGGLLIRNGVQQLNGACSP
jgi:hypothetical protein